MNLGSLKLKLQGSQTGLSLYDGDSYFATYRSLNDCVLDLVYHFRADELNNIVKAFSEIPNYNIIEPFEYRGVCSEMFLPTDTVFRYVYYRKYVVRTF